MRLLLDTHCWLWMTKEPERFCASSRTLVESTTNDLFFSAASAWEIAVKSALGKLKVPVSPADYIETRLRQIRTAPLAITHLHAARVGELPFHHKDPFDRLIIAQAQLERLPVMTADPRFKPYDVEVIDA